MSKEQMVPPGATAELTAEQVQRIFAVAESEPVRALQEKLVDGTKRAADPLQTR